METFHPEPQMRTSWCFLFFFLCIWTTDAELSVLCSCFQLLRRLSWELLRCFHMYSVVTYRAQHYLAWELQALHLLCCPWTLDTGFRVYSCQKWAERTWIINVWCCHHWHETCMQQLCVWFLAICAFWEKVGFALEPGPFETCIVIKVGYTDVISWHTGWNVS